MRGVALLALLAVGCAHVSVAERPARTVEESLEQIEQAAATAFAKSGEPNLALGIVHGGKLMWFRGLGRSDPARPSTVDENSVFRIGSLTKLFTGVALLQLRDAGKVQLDDPLSKFIPEAASVLWPSADHRPITLRHLVSHTSGLPREALDASGPHTEAALVGALSGLALEFTPGTEASYSNYGMQLAGLVIARASGESYRDYMRRHLFEPLGLTSATWDAPPERLALGERRGPRGLEAAPLETFGAAEAAGGLFLSAADLARFAAFELSAWTDGPESAVLSRASLRESQSPQNLALTDGDFCGVNWFVSQFGEHLGRMLAHSGQVSGYRATIQLFPNRDLATIALTSSDDDPANELLQGISTKAAQLLAWTLPVKQAPLDGPLAAALERLMVAVNEPPPEAKLPDLFGQTGWDFAKTAADIQTVHAQVGRCAGPPGLLRAGPRQATVVYGCERSPLRIHFGLEPKSPRIAFLWFSVP